MRRFFLGMTLGHDPHTVGIYKAGRIGKLGGIDFEVLSPDDTDEEKLAKIAEYDPEFLGLSYRLSPDKAVEELKKFMQKMEAVGLISKERKRKICFAALLPSLRTVHSIALARQYNIQLMGSYENLKRTTQNTISFFQFPSDVARNVENIILEEAMVPRIELLDQLAKSVLENDDYLTEPPLPIPSEEARKSLVQRIDESEFPVIRSHFGIPADTIDPTIEGIAKISNARVIDELSLGSSDLSQRFFGDPGAFKGVKNDGGVPYKNKEDLIRLKAATQSGNYPSIKPYCHVKNIIPFIDICLETGMLIGAHQAVPLFWFSELDGRGPMSVDDAIREHKEAIRYLVKKGIPTEMNDPNQWSSRYAHDAVFVTDYALIAAIMYKAGSPNMIFQMQFNKPADTGDFADLAKFTAARDLIEEVRPTGNNSRIIIETRAGIEHFSTNMKVAKFQLARSVMLQMLMNPSILHLVSYCEADHAATPDDVIESSKILRRAVRVFREHEADIRKAVNDSFVKERHDFLINQAHILMEKIGHLGKMGQCCASRQVAERLSDTQALQLAMKYRIMAAPGISDKKYATPEMITHAGKHGEIDCYRLWDDVIPLDEKERLDIMKKYLLEI